MKNFALLFKKEFSLNKVKLKKKKKVKQSRVRKQISVIQGMAGLPARKPFQIDFKQTYKTKLLSTVKKIDPFLHNMDQK